MPKKKGKKGGKKKNLDSSKLAPVDKTFYELIIADLNNKLAKLRKQIATVETKNVTLTEQLSELKEDRTDVAEHLQRTLVDRNDVIVELEERLTEVLKVRNQEKVEAEQSIKKLEAKYKSVHEQLTSEIKLLNGKLNSLDEFRIQRDHLLAKFDDQEAALKEKERLHKEELFNIEQQAVIEKDALKKDVEAKLMQVSDDFTRSSEIRNAGYTRRLIRENIALQKEIDVVVEKQIRLQSIYNRQVIKNREIDEEFAAMEQIRDHLIATGNNQLDLIHKLSIAYEQIQCKYMEALKYRKLYEANLRTKICKRFLDISTEKRVSILKQRLKVLKAERKELIDKHNRLDYEVKHLNEVITDIKVAVHGTLENWENQGLSDDEVIAITKLKRKTLLSRLMEVISNHSDKLSVTPPMSRGQRKIYRPGSIGFITKECKLKKDVLERDLKRILSSEAETARSSELPTYKAAMPKSNIRSEIESTIIDAQLSPCDNTSSIDLTSEATENNTKSKLTSDQRSAQSKATSKTPHELPETEKYGDETIRSMELEEEDEFEINLHY